MSGIGKGTRIQREVASTGDAGAPGAANTPGVGKQSRVEGVGAIAERGTAAASSRLPHFDTIQRLFGKFDISGVEAHAGAEAAGAARALGARSYATGDHVVMGGDLDLFSAAHEAAHVVQQRAGAVPAGLDAGRGDPLEQHANDVAAAVVRGESAEPLLERFAAGARAGGGTSGFAAMAVQRLGNDPDDPAIATIFESSMTPEFGVEALLASPAPQLVYGREPGTDEEVEITGGASYLHERKRNWRDELTQRSMDPASAQQQPWEKFQTQMGAMTPAPANAPPWFMDPGFGYQVTGANAAKLAAIGTERDTPDPEDPQQLLGMSYQRDTMYSIESDPAAPIQRHQQQVDAGTPAATYQAWANDVLRLSSAGTELRIRIASAADDATDAVITGTILEGPVANAGLAPGTAVQLRRAHATGTLAVHAGGALIGSVAGGTWTGRLESFAYHQGRTRIDEGLGATHPDARRPRARNRGNQPALDDAMFEQVENRYDNPMNPDRDDQHTLGPDRTRVNIEETGWDVNVARYRRLGGDAIFREADHPAPAPYRNELQPASAVDVNNPDWYYDQANQMPDRFVGGRSNSTGLYLSSATMLYHEGRLTLEEAKDVLAFVIADMVVSGEHSMPECMTTVVMAAGSSQPWQATDLNLAGPTSTLAAWLRLVDAGTRQTMRADALARLTALVDTPQPDLRLIKAMTILAKAL